MYWEYNVIICIFLKASLQDYLTPELVMILAIFFCKTNNLLALENLPPKIMPIIFSSLKYAVHFVCVLRATD
jgi:hypothetical protein